MYLDVAVSWFYHHQMDPIMETSLDFDSFANFFMKNEGTMHKILIRI